MPRPFKPRKTGIYWLCKVVPAPLWAIVGKVELKESLHTRDPEEAKEAKSAVEDRFLASARAQLAGSAAQMTLRQIDAILGVAYSTPRAGKRASSAGCPELCV